MAPLSDDCGEPQLPQPIRGLVSPESFFESTDFEILSEGNSMPASLEVSMRLLDKFAVGGAEANTPGLRFEVARSESPATTPAEELVKLQYPHEGSVQGEPVPRAQASPDQT